MGDQVYLKLQPYKWWSLALKPNEKLRPRYYGPYVVLEHIGQVAYKLQLPTSAKIHDVFHISQLKKHVGLEVQPQQLPEGFRMISNRW